MVGDKKHDILGARQFGIPCVAVSYGYGTMEELTNENPHKIVIWNTLCRSILRIRNNGRTNKRKPSQNRRHSRRTTRLLTKQLIE